MEGKQGFIKGMDQDTALNKRDPNSYFSAHNLRIVTGEGTSMGSLEVEKGTALSFKIPDIPEMVLTDGTIIPAQTDLKILNITSMIDELLVFTTNETSSTPNGYGQLWKCKYDEATNSIIGLLPSNKLDITLHLFYNQKLNFSTEYRIGRVVTLVETKNKVRAYWTDNYNNLRTFNYAVDNPLDTPLSSLDIFPGVNMTQPIVQSIGVGNLETPSQIQFTYRLLSVNGGSTTYAPPTALTPLPNQTVEANSFATWEAGGTGNNKSVTYELVNLDTDYDVIQHIAVVYSNSGSTTIWQFAEDSIPSSGNMTVVCSTLANAISIPFEEYSVIESGFDKCKDIEVQGNRLIAANISTNASDFEFDARAYRFNNPITLYAPETPTFPHTSLVPTPIALLKDSNNNLDDLILLGGVNTPDWNSIPEEHDAINIYNKEQENNWFDPAQQYKYQADGVTLGGEGPNIKYKFTTKTVVGNSTFDTKSDAPNHITVPSYQINEAPIYNGTLNPDGTLRPIYIQNQIANMAGPWAHSNFTGYARGETYRFAIVTYDKKDVPTFVKWIGDIKFPDVADGFPLQTYVGGQAQLHQLGIEFSVDVSSIADKISGYSIVRLPREDKDRSKLGTGFFMHFDLQTSVEYDSLMHRYFITGLGIGSGANDPFPVVGNYQYYGDDSKSFLHLADRPGQTKLTRSNDIYNRLAYLISPFGSLYTSNFTETDYIETLEYYNAELYNYYDDAGNTGVGGTDSDFAFFYKLKQQAYPTHPLERLQVQKSKDLYPGEVILTSNDFMSDLNTSLGANGGDAANTSYTRDKALLISGTNEYVPLGIGAARRFLRLHTPSSSGGTDLTPTLPHVVYQAPEWQNVSNPGDFTFWYGPTDPGSSIELDFNGGYRTTEDVTFKSVGYRRYLLNQYGGNSFESRSTNSYQYIGHYQSTKPVAAHNLTTQVFGGDVYVNYYDEEMLERNISAVQNPLEIFKPNGDNHLGVAVCGPVESMVNTNWRNGRNWAKDRESTNMGAYAQNSTSIYPVWNKEDEVQNKFFAEDFLSQYTTEHPFQLWASNVKINGELSDSWRQFPIANKTEVDGIHGPINRILSFKNNLLFYQDKAFGIASLDERSIIQDQSGQELVLGDGGVFPTYTYLSKNTGTIHQFSVVDTESAVYHYDARLKKFYQFTGGPTPLSDLKGMSSFFANNVLGTITEIDKTTRAINPTGVHGVYDQRFNRVLYTFLGTESTKNIKEFRDVNGNYVFPPNSYVTVGTVTYYTELGTTILATDPPTSPNLAVNSLFKVVEIGFTISYNEMLQNFESFYDYKPTLYLEYGRRLLSVSPYENNKAYVHNEGLYGQYYDTLISTSKLHTILAQPYHINKIWNNLSWFGEVYDLNGNDKFDVTLDRIKYFNNYQESPTVFLANDAKRRMRTWRTIIPRELDNSLSRFRNPWLECVLEYDNTNGYRHILHELIYSFSPIKF